MIWNYTVTSSLMADRLIDNLLNPINLYDTPFERNSIVVTLRYCRRNNFFFNQRNRLSPEFYTNYQFADKRIKR